MLHTRQGRLTTGIILIVSTALSGCKPGASDPGIQAGISPVSIHCAPQKGQAIDSNAVAAKARSFAGLLNTEERGKLEAPFTRENAVRWSNLPVSSVQRQGVMLGDLDAAKQTAAEDLIQAVLSSCGARMAEEIRLADEYIKPLSTRFAWGSGRYYVGFLGTPSGTSPWLLKIGGHHLAINLTFNGRMPGATPQFNGVEPIKFNVAGTEHEPMSRQSSAMAALGAAVYPFPEARLVGTFTDVVKGVEYSIVPGPRLVGGNDTTFPSVYPSGTAGRGVPFGKLSAADKRTVIEAISSFTDLSDGRMSKALFSDYTRPSALAGTYIGFSGSPDLTTENSYVRIDGPRLWMELVVQRAVAYPDQLHFHAVWRDKEADYGGEFHH
jgi:Protein of unknown function (DUF3500)